MPRRTLSLPFVIKTPVDIGSLSYPAELACVTCFAESQRKKPTFLRETHERIAYIAKVYYPLWILPAENACLIIDGLNGCGHEFTFEEPVKTANLVEELKRNSGNPQQFVETLKAQTEEAKAFTSPVRTSFKGIVKDKELLDFFTEYLNSGTFLDLQENNVIPAEVDSRTAEETARALVNCLRTLEADAKGLRYALDVLEEELEFHVNAARSEIERLQEKFDGETEVLKPIIDKTLKILTQKHEKTIATLQKSLDLKIAALEKRLERCLHKLLVAERRKDAVKQRIESAKKKKTSSRSSSGLFALKRYEREINNTKKEIKAATDEIDKVRREGKNTLKQRNEEFQKAVAEEENKLAQLTDAHKVKSAKKRRQIEEMALNASTLTKSLENCINELKRSGLDLRSHVLVDVKQDYPEEAVLVQLPVYFIMYIGGEDERHGVVLPIVIAQESSTLSGIKNMLAINPDPKPKILIRSANKKLQETFCTAIVEKIKSDQAFRTKISEMCRNGNITDQSSFEQTLKEGLDEIERKGWMTHEETAAICRQIMGESA